VSRLTICKCIGRVYHAIVAADLPVHLTELAARALHRETGRYHCLGAMGRLYAGAGGIGIDE
jgi:hypothetical protein